MKRITWLTVGCICAVILGGPLLLRTKGKAELGSPSALPVRFGTHVFEIPAAYLLSGRPIVNSRENTVLLGALLPELTPAPPIASDAWLKLRDNVVVATLTYNGPSYSGRASADLFLKVSTGASNGQRLEGYTASLVPGGQDLYVANRPDLRPVSVLCFGPNPPRNSKGGVPCSVFDEIAPDEYPVKKDGRFPLVLEYTFQRTHLENVGTIDAAMRKLVTSWQVSRD